ncbi:hypothetical protein BDW66DRAFT_155604 [Aspergillus desertorum]
MEAPVASVGDECRLYKRPENALGEVVRLLDTPGGPLLQWNQPPQRHRAFLASEGPSIIFSSLWDTFCTHNITEVPGPTLIHRHFDLKTDQTIVDVNGTFPPWILQPQQPEKQEVLKFTIYGGHIQPCAWIALISGDGDGQLMPFDSTLST